MIFCETKLINRMQLMKKKSVLSNAHKKKNNNNFVYKKLEEKNLKGPLIK